MALWSIRWTVGRTGWLTLVGLVTLLAQAGCGGGGKPGEPAAQTTAAAETPKGETQEAAASAKPVALQVDQEQSFLDATVQDPPEDEQQPPDKTIAGKSIGKLYKLIVGDEGKGGLWEQVKFRSPGGKSLHYSAHIKTAAGTIVMELWPDVAPNHVRNFVALARAGYYDGLAFDRAVKEQPDESVNEFVEYVEAGCPKGTGQAGYGSIGYWLKPEIKDKVRHEAGTVGASHGADPESAACKFYITLNRAESLDGEYTVFGKITQGMDVVRKIYEHPRLRSGNGMDGGDGRLEHSVVIDRVDIHVEER